MANLIATEEYAKNIGGVSASYTPKLGCTKSRAIALGCNVAGTYTDKQLVCQKDLSKASTIQYSLKNVSTDYLTNVKVQADNCVFAKNGTFAPDEILYTTGLPSGSSWSISINGSISSKYIVFPNPNYNTYIYYLSDQTYRYDVIFTQTSAVSGSTVRVFMLSNMDSTLVGTKNYLRDQVISNTYLIYYQNVDQPSSNIGTFTGNKCYNQNGPITMINGNKYSVLYTEIDSSISNANHPGYIITPWKRLCEFTFYSDIYYYSLNVSV